MSWQLSFFTIYSYSFIFYLSSFLPACLPVSFLFVCLSVCLSICQSVSQSHGLPVCRPLFRPALPVTCPALLRHTTHNSSSRFDKGLTLDVSFRVPFWWPVHIINPVDKTKLSPLQRFGCEVLDSRLRCSHGQLFSFLMAAILYCRLQ